MTACSASAVNARPGQWINEWTLGSTSEIGHTGSCRGMLPNFPYKLRHLVPIPLTACLVQQLDIMCGFSLFALQEEWSVKGLVQRGLTRGCAYAHVCDGNGGRAFFTAWDTGRFMAAA